MKKNIVILLLASLFLFPAIINAQVNEQDSLALVDLYNSTDGPNWNGGNWLSGNRVSGWNGITVENGRVTEIDLLYDMFLRWPKINGSLPESIGNLSALTKLRISGLSGAIPGSICNLKSLTVLSLRGSFTGGIPENIGNLNKLIRLSLSYNLSGNIPESIGKLTALTHLSLSKNNLTGVIPESIGNLTNLKSLELETNDLQGEIPESIGKLTLLTSFYIGGNDFSGQLPNHFENLDLLEILKLEGAFTGEIPSTIGDMDSLKFLEIYDFEGGLTGGIPESFGNLSNLSRLYIGGISGEIPESIGNLKNLNVFSIARGNFTGEIPNSIGNLTALTEFIVSYNNLSGEIPESIGNMSALTAFSVSQNNLSGEIPSTIEKLTNLTNLRLNDNHFSAITKTPPNLTALSVQNNNLDYNDLEPLAEKEIEDFRFVKQDTLSLELTIDNKETKLTMHAGGSATTYQWFYDNGEVLDATNNTYIIPSGKEIQKYHCEAKNVHLPNLTLIGVYKKKEEKDCWETGSLTFCLSSGEWEKGSGTNKIKTTNIISINDFLFFDGTMSLDTTVLEIEANGEFYVDNIPLPLGSVGKYTLLKGEHKLTLDGELGKIKDFLNSKLKVSAKLFGAPLKIDDLVFVKRNDTLGVSVGCSVQIPGVTGNCGILGLTPIDIAISNLEVTNKGILLGGFSIENLGLGVKDHCLNELTYNYNSKRDILTGGMHFTTPFFENVGGGFKVEKGLLDSIAWELEPDLKPIPTGIASLGVKGFYGHIATITQPVMDIKLGGIFSDLVSADLYRIKASGRTKWPSFFEMEGKGQFLRPILNELPFQLEGDVTMGVDIPDERLWINLYGQFGTLDEKIWLIDGIGNFNISLHKEIPPTFSGNMDGWITLPKLSDDVPFSWLNTIFEFPIIAETKNNFTHNYPNLVAGVVSVKTANHGPYSLEYVLDVTKTWYQSGYIRFPYFEKIEEFAVNDNKSGLLVSNVTKTFTVPEDNEIGVIEIKSNEQVPTSSITSPLGKKYSESSATDNILYSESKDKKEAFWTLLAADPGDWSITLENPSQNDSIITFFQLNEQEFKFSMNQTENTVTVIWDVAQVEEGQTVNLMLDDDNADFDGFRITEGQATLGRLSFTLDESTPDCNYYLYAQLVDSFNVIQSYADEAIDNPLATLAPPENLSSEYNSETGEFNFTWTENPTSEITGYILSVTDELGNDSIYAILNSDQTSISLFIEDFETKSAKIESYNQDWKIGCPTTAVALSTSLDEFYELEKPTEKIMVYPNPTTGSLTIRYFVEIDSKCQIMIIDINGRQIAQPFSGFQTAGFHEVGFEYNDIPNGIYFIKFVNNNESFTVKSILNK